MNRIARLWSGVTSEEVAHLAHRDHASPHRVLGAHPVDGGWVVRTWRPGAASVLLDRGRGRWLAMERIHDDGLWAAWVRNVVPPGVRVRATRDGVTWTAREPWNFLPTVGDLDLHLFGEGRHQRLHEVLGAHPRRVDGIDGVAFAVWAPTARAVSVVGDWNLWDDRAHPMRTLGASGVWEIFVPEVPVGAKYQFELVTARGERLRKTDPFAARTENRPAQSSIVFASQHAWGDGGWVAARDARSAQRGPMSVYELHATSWRHGPDGAWLSWRDLAPLLADYVSALGFTHVELLPVCEHPFDGSWGYQVTGYFAPTARHGDPDDFRAFVDHLHARGIGVIVDWVPAHFPRDPHALARFDGTALFEHPDPRLGDHPDWGTHVFNFGRVEVRNFLLASARAWVADFHVDGLRVDAVASMLYLDYSRPAGQWVPNAHGGRENLEAVSLLQTLNEQLHAEFPGVAVIAEESTAWPGVTRPVFGGGLGFTLKWNMGWMHDTLGYFQRDPIHRAHHHHQLTFGLVYAWSEHFVLALSHDEVVHGKRSLLEKMPGDRWQRFANLRALYAWMWGHPGRKLLFMGAEIAAVREWNEAATLDWGLLDDGAHRGVSRLVGDLNALYRATPALWRHDDAPEGFQWLDADDASSSVLAFARFGDDGDAPVIVVLNATPVVHEARRVGVPAAGAWRVVLNTDAAVYGGSDVGNVAVVHTQRVTAHGRPDSLVLRVPPLAVVILAREIP